ncbi:histone-lysine N-methyltransferase ASHR3 [Tanacetum coccineum]
MTSNSVDDHFNDSVSKKKSGVSDSKLFLPFLEGARKLHAAPASSIEEVFRRLPLPYTEKEFSIDLTMVDNAIPASSIKVRCLNISCSSVCKCSENCTNRPFQEAKKLKLIKTQDRGWGVEAAEFINEGDFIIEYVGEGDFIIEYVGEGSKFVAKFLDEAVCERRFWDMKAQGVTQFYMVSVRKDFNIDASVKGNESRFLNHSCDPNCELQQWDVNGMTCLGIFANSSIEPGEELTFDYRFELYGEEVECRCGASNCRGHLGTKKKTSEKKKTK